MWSSGASDRTMVTLWYLGGGKDGNIGGDSDGGGSNRAMVVVAVAVAGLQRIVEHHLDQIWIKRFIFFPRFGLKDNQHIF